MRYRLALKILSVLLLGWNAFFFAACDNAPGQAASKPPPRVATLTAEPRPFERTLELTGTLEPTRVARIASPAEGPVIMAHVREGDAVKAGQVLVSIGRQVEAIATLSTARDALAVEKKNLERVQHLVTIGAAAAEEAERAQLAVSQAEAKLASARQGSGDHQIRAPWSGIVSRVLVSDGAFVAPRETLVEVFDPASIVLRLAAPDSHAMLVRTDAPVHVSLDSYPGKRFEGKVSRVYPELDRRTRTRVLEVSLAGNDDLAPGVFGRARIVLETVPAAITVPEGAVVVTPKQERVVFVLEDGKAKQRKVRTGLDVDGQIQIVEGVNAGEQVIVRGHERLEDGVAVKVAKSKPAARPSASAAGSAQPGAGGAKP